MPINGEHDARKPVKCVPSQSPDTTDAYLSTDHPDAAELLGQAGLRAAATLRHGSRRGHVAHRHFSALGVDLKQNDIRFVEDDWENPTLGAWGLGWEVWLNGMEVTQFTYFQQVGGIDCKPITGEITYGLERLAMYLQGVENVFDLTWAEGLTYRDVYHQNEVEQSTYNFEHSDVEFLLSAFSSHEKQAKHLMEQQLALPAYEQVLKAAHSFNLLDARGASSVPG